MPELRPPWPRRLSRRIFQPDGAPEPGTRIIRTRGSFVLRLAARALRRPRLVPALMRAGWRFRARGWYRRPPFLPLPPRRYLDWRLETAYGAGGAEPTDRELERYLEWVARIGSPGGRVSSGGRAHGRDAGQSRDSGP